MKKIAKLFGIGVFLLLISAPVFAEEEAPEKQGIYFSAKGGMSWLNDADFDFDVTFDGITVPFEGEAEYDTGYHFGGALGYEAGSVRTEIEVIYRDNDIDQISDFSAPGLMDFGDLDASGDIYSLSYMANVFYDFKNSTSFTPYIGVGAGAATIKVDGLRIEETSMGSDTDTVLAYQASCGIGYNATKNTTIEVGYRYYATEDPDFGGNYGDMDGEYESHDLTFGVRYNFW
jgi:opacity protein-like surface antigen